MDVEFRSLNSQPLILCRLPTIRDIQRWVELQAARLPTCVMFTKGRGESWRGSLDGTTSISSCKLRFSYSPKWIHCISVRWAEQFIYNYSINNWAWLLGHFSRRLLTIKESRSHNSSAFMNNKEKKLGETCIEQFLYWLNWWWTINGLFRNRNKNINALSTVIFFSVSSIFNIFQCNYI